MAKPNPRTGTTPTNTAAKSMAGEPLRLVVQVEIPRRRLLSVPFTHPIVIGRADNDDQSQPDMDLGSAGARESGVSRLHARFEYRSETLYVEDLGSTNGTRINGFDLTPGKSYRLATGDEIELGSMRLTTRVVRG